MKRTYERNRGYVPPVDHSLVRYEDHYRRDRDRVEYTAAYRDPETKIYYLAEGGAGSLDRRSGLSWYQSKKEAKQAVELVYLASLPIQR